MSMSDSGFGDLHRHLPSNAHLVFNESRVFSARVFATATGSTTLTEILFLSAEAPSQDPAVALLSPLAGQVWRCMIRKHYNTAGSYLHFTVPGSVSDDITIRAEVVKIHSEWEEEEEENGVEADVRLMIESSERVLPTTSLILSDVLTRCGEVPLPPYLNRETEKEDAQAYQNVFASTDAAGSVAAPTAGLHFTQPLLQQLRDRGVKGSTLVLHVSAATFRPVTAKCISDHNMHAERFEIRKHQLVDLIESLKQGKVIIPVGTTSCRLLESLYWLGVKEWKAAQGDHEATGPATVKGTPEGPLLSLSLAQWEAYHLGASSTLPCSPIDSYTQLLHRIDRSGTDKLFGYTSLCIVPGYNFSVASALVTNFHQPDSTLLLLVAAFLHDHSGRRLLDVYNHAIKQDYKFLSYGDACLFKNTTT